MCDSDFDLKVLNKKQSEEQTKDQHVRELESALEEVRSTFFVADLVLVCSCLEEEVTSTFCCHRFLFVV